ncbi:type II toxin-antitoxin system PemK/MazF family toxin [Lactiplantibacillus dongliensis]|uniref:Type II toxin-antitoxin system PemK/MazF family toxin n=1 Tax=Lactiplantibacillus dongliensis TaxID=2559919 RepID=A0ABW1RA09_9LACO|nr:type II toxin-antitoxin system PemK/MazF family toxin [Lactiplantibacillus dongliensis]
MNSKVVHVLKPVQREIVWIDFQPSQANELRGRHPAVGLSTAGFSELTGQVAVSPITHATHNHLKTMFIPINNNPKINGFVNPLQFHTFSIIGRHIESTGTLLDIEAFARVIRIHQQLLNIY